MNPPPPTEDKYASRSTFVRGITASFILFATVVVLLRVYTRLVLVRMWRMEDWLILVALAWAEVVFGTVWRGVHDGFGRHVDAISPEGAMGYAEYLMWAVIAYNMTLTFCKLSVLCLYLSFFVQKKDRIACYCMIAFVVAYGIQIFFTGLFNCKPIAFFWDKSIPGGTCISQDVLWYMNAGVNFGTDIIILMLPVRVIYKLHMATRQKIVLLFIFALGYFTFIASIMRFFYLKQAANSQDVTWDLVTVSTWSMIEMGMAILAACLPTMKPLASRFAPRLLGSSSTPSAREQQLRAKQAQFGDGSNPSGSGSGRSGGSSKKHGLATDFSEADTLATRPGDEEQYVGLDAEKQQQRAAVGDHHAVTAPHESLAPPRSPVNSNIRVTTELSQSIAGQRRVNGAAPPQPVYHPSRY